MCNCHVLCVERDARERERAAYRAEVIERYVTRLS